MNSLRLAGATNFRSLGGLPAADGRTIRPHALMRADRLSRLTDADWRQLAATGLATICDLRSTAERSEHPTQVPAHLGVRELHCEIRNDLRADPTLALDLAADPSARGAERLMIEIYRRFPRYMGPTLRSVLDLLLDDGAPLLVHCSAGKDRTGFVVAMLLHALEVPGELIRADYLASRGWAGGELHRASLAARLATLIPPDALDDAVDTVLDVRDAYLDAALAALTAEFGSIDAYLHSEAGLDPRRRDQLRARLLT
ncbi:MAG: tyrosine-protein phosphatase [Steroidobacteraceae bacterium]